MNFYSSVQAAAIIISLVSVIISVVDELEQHNIAVQCVQKKKHTLHKRNDYYSTFQDGHFKLAGYLNWYNPYQNVDSYNFSAQQYPGFVRHAKAPNENRKEKIEHLNILEEHLIIFPMHF